MEELTYICSKCKTEKPISEFAKANDRTRGHKSSCRECDKLYYKNNADRLLATKKIYRDKNKDKINQHRLDNIEKDKKNKRDYYNKNKEYFLLLAKEYREIHKLEIKEKQSEYQKKNRERLRKHNIASYHRHKDKRRIASSKYAKNRRGNDDLYRFITSARNAIKQSFVRNKFKKQSFSTDILCCSMEMFKEHIASKFEPWMNWSNYGKYNGEYNYGWDLDHIIPISTAQTIDDVISLCHYTNFQPLCSKINRDIKNDKINYKVA